MGLFKTVGLDPYGLSIDWELTPADTFGTFESWGGRERVRNRSERFYYFYIDGWRTPPKVCLMERGIKHARVLAVIDAPQDMVDACIKEQGGIISLDRSYAINRQLRNWLSDNLFANYTDRLVTPLRDEKEERWGSCDVGSGDFPVACSDTVSVPEVRGTLVDEQIKSIVMAGNFFEANLNPSGRFDNLFMDNGDGLTVTDCNTGLMWQRSGHDAIVTNRQAANYCRKLNETRFAGHDDWRLPSLTEALSLLVPEKTSRGLHLHPCFSVAQPFIFVDHRRKPGGQWYIDFNVGMAFWASGHNPGGFVRLCRSV